MSETTGIIGAHPSHPWFNDKVQRSTLDSRPSSRLKLPKYFTTPPGLSKSPLKLFRLAFRSRQDETPLVELAQCIAPKTALRRTQ
jgi:hypothetical protein